MSHISMIPREKTKKQVLKEVAVSEKTLDIAHSSCYGPHHRAANSMVSHHLQCIVYRFRSWCVSWRRFTSLMYATKMARTCKPRVSVLDVMAQFRRLAVKAQVTQFYDLGDIFQAMVSRFAQLGCVDLVSMTTERAAPKMLSV